MTRDEFITEVWRGERGGKRASATVRGLPITIRRVEGSGYWIAGLTQDTAGCQYKSHHGSPAYTREGNVSVSGMQASEDRTYFATIAAAKARVFDAMYGKG
jgi:hypothetical protein